MVPSGQEMILDLVHPSFQHKNRCTKQFGLGVVISSEFWGAQAWIFVTGKGRQVETPRDGRVGLGDV